MKNVEGLREVQRNLAKKISGVKNMSKSAIRDVSFDLKGNSQDLAPVDTGDLRRSAYTKFEDRPGGFTGEIGYGAEYAYEQHENLEYRHPQGGQAKYLEQPLKENLGKYARYIKDKSKGAMR